MFKKGATFTLKWDLQVGFAKIYEILDVIDMYMFWVI